MNSLVRLAALAAVAIPAAAPAQLVDPQMSREIGRAVGEATVAAEAAAAQARTAAQQAMQEARRGYAEGSGRPVAPPPPQSAGIVTEDDAAEACSIAAEDEGYAFARLASIRDIDSVRRVTGGWEVQGTLETRESWRAQRRDPWTFVCRVEGGEIVDVQLRDFVARR